MKAPKTQNQIKKKFILTKFLHKTYYARHGYLNIWIKFKKGKYLLNISKSKFHNAILYNWIVMMILKKLKNKNKLTNKPIKI